VLYEQYEEKAKLVAAFVDVARYTEAIDLLQELIDSDLSDIDKSMMCINMAVVYEKMAQPERALFWYDHGISYEAIYFRGFVGESKAAYLYKLQRYAECLEIYRELSEQAFQTEVDKLRLQQNITTVINAMK